MSAPMEATQQQDCSALKDELAKVTDKMMTLKLSQLKKRAKKNGIPEEAIEEAAAGAGDEEDAKCVLISLILKAACVKATPSPTRARSDSKMMFHAHTCAVCPGCIRVPGHDGLCMDGDCNEISLEIPKHESGLDVGAEVARHKVVKGEVARKVEEQAAAEDVARRKMEKDKTLRKAAEEEAERKVTEELQALRKAAADEEAARQRAAAEGAAQQKVADEKAVAQQKAAELEAAQQKAAELEAALQKVAELEAARQKAADETAARQKAVEEEAARQKAAEEEAAQQKAADEEAARQKEAEEEDARQTAAEAAVREKEMEEKRARRQAEEEAEEAAMDARCVDTFLQCTTWAGSWRDNVRTPIKGTILYTKHMRPCRAAGTSVDVKDSSFRSLLNFLQFLESEGLLRLKPGLTDPVVTDIYFDACRNYKYVPQVPCATKETDQQPQPGKSAYPSQQGKVVQKLSDPPVSGGWLGPLGCAKRFQ